MKQLSEKTLGDWLEHWASHTPDKEYIVYSDRNLRFTWKTFNQRVDNMAKGLLAIGITHGTHVRYLGRKCTRLAYFSLCMRKNRCCSCYGQYQLQAGRTGISLREFGYAYPLYCQRRKRQQLCRDDLYHAARTENIRTRTHEKQTVSLHEKRHLHRAGKIPGNVQYIGNPAAGQQHRR